jgi:hypothetical protein
VYCKKIIEDPSFSSLDRTSKKSRKFEQKVIFVKSSLLVIEKNAAND